MLNALNSLRFLCLNICSSICLCIQGNQLDTQFFKLFQCLSTVEARRNSTPESLQSQEKRTRLRTSALKKEVKEKNWHFDKGISQNTELVAVNPIVQTLP